MSEFDAAAAAVQAALDAGARYADARVMHRRYESMAARNGDVEDARRSTRTPGIGVRALVGSGWGFFAVPDLTDAAVRGGGAQAAAIAAASALVSRAASDARRRATPASGSWASECEIDPLGVSLSTKGDLLVGATTTMREHGADLAEGLYQVWDTAKWFVSSEGHRIDQHVRECGAGIMATVDRRRRDPAPLVPGGARPVRHAGLGARRRSSTCGAHAARSPTESRALLRRRRARAGRRR